MDKSNVIDFEDAKLMRAASNAIEEMDLLFKEASKYPDDPEAVAFLAEWSGKMQELAAETAALMKEIEDLEKINE